MASSERKFRARIKVIKHIQIHTTLSTAAYHFHKRVHDRIALNDQSGITYDIMAGIIFLAFAAEAQINFLGERLVPGWKERAGYKDKVHQVFHVTNITADFNQRPFNCLFRLKTIRDMFAHGKPVVKMVSDEVVMSESEIEQLRNLDPEWLTLVTGENLNELYSDADEVWEWLLGSSGVERYDASTHGNISVEYLGEAE